MTSPPEVCEDDDDTVASLGYPGVKTCSDAATMFGYSRCENEHVRDVCCQSCSVQSTTDGEEYCESGKISDEECERSTCCHLNRTIGGCWSSIGQSLCNDMDEEEPTHEYGECCCEHYPGQLEHYCTVEAYCSFHGDSCVATVNCASEGYCQTEAGSEEGG